MGIKNDRLLILDYGSQYTRLIARCVREAGVYCEIWPSDITLERIHEFAPKGIILSGGPNSVYDEGAPQLIDGVLKLGLPILGICYGLQLITHSLGGSVESSHEREYGKAYLDVVDADDVLLKPLMLNESPVVWMSHADRVSQLASGFISVAKTENSPYAAVRHEQHPWWGIQFHPEVTHTESGRALLAAFAIDICGCKADWTADAIRKAQVESIRNKVGSDAVLLGLSGGVDSSVAGALIAEAVGEQLICVFVDNGLLRLNEGDEVERIFRKHYPSRFIRVNAQSRFLSALKGVSDPEEKRKIIGKVFIDVFEEEAEKHPEVKWLGQGTIYPDVIESAGAGGGAAKVIKSHHNVGGLPDYMKLELLEPLRDLFKDEVRQVGLELGLGRELVFRHPFPGPGLGVRVLGEVKEQYLEPLRKADDIFIKALRQHGLYDRCSQAFTVFLPVKSVGVVGDNRAYEYVVALRAVETSDFMTATAANLPHDFIEAVATRIMNEVSGISRVVYDVSSKPPSTIEWE